MRSGSIWVTDVFIKSSHRRKAIKNTLLLFDSDQWAFKVLRESDSIICRGMNILWSELIRCSGSRELRGEFVLFQIICVINYTSLRLNNMKTTQLQLEEGGWRAVFTLHTSKRSLAHFFVRYAQLTLWRPLWN